MKNRNKKWKHQKTISGGFFHVEILGFWAFWCQPWVGRTLPINIFLPRIIHSASIPVYTMYKMDFICFRLHLAHRPRQASPPLAALPPRPPSPARPPTWSSASRTRFRPWLRQSLVWASPFPLSTGTISVSDPYPNNFWMFSYHFLFTYLNKKIIYYFTLEICFIRVRIFEWSEMSKAAQNTPQSAFKTP